MVVMVGLRNQGQVLVAEKDYSVLSKLRDFQVNVPNRNLLPRAVAAGKQSIGGLNQMGRAIGSGKALEAMKQWGREAIRGPDTRNIPLQLPSGAQTVLSTTPNLRPEDYNRADAQALVESIARMKSWPK